MQVLAFKRLYVEILLPLILLIRLVLAIVLVIVSDSRNDLIFMMIIHFSSNSLLSHI